jgi:FkbH-like protein
MTYADILQNNSLLENKLKNLETYTVSILSNVIVAQEKEILEFQLRSMDINAVAEIGDYDNILQNSLTVKSDAVLIFWEAANIVEGFSYKAGILSDDGLQQVLEKVKSEIEMVFKNLSSVPLVIINSFSSLPFTYGNFRVNQFEKICKELNLYIEKNAPSNVLIADINKIYSRVSIEKSIDWRYWYSSKAPYTVEFFKAYSELIKPLFLSINGKAKKALLVDCDNTLWKGVIGEDGIEGIVLSSNVKGGAVFEEIQSRIVALANEGVIIGLVSKNNPADVEEVLVSHPDMVLRNLYIISKKINWQEKPKNVRELVNELNIGMESCVFLDDSDFETGYMKEQLPEISVFLVPHKIYNYPSLLRELEQLFFTLNISKEDKIRTEMYKNEQKRNEDKSTFTSVEDYLVSLNLIMTLFVDDENLVQRLAQMTQKTNQFNLTTKRYSESEILHFINSKNHTVIAFGLKDKFGDTGITGMCILEYENDAATIDSLLMSCRVLGRNVEIVFMDQIISIVKKRNAVLIKSAYYQTLKNAQVADFYQKMGFLINVKSEKLTEYDLYINNYSPSNINYIKIEYGK